MIPTPDDFADFTVNPTFVQYNPEMDNRIDHTSNPESIFLLLEREDNWNFTPLEVLMANATPVPF